MSYTGRKKYVSRQDKAKRISKNLRMTVIVVTLFILGLCYYRRIDIMDYIGTYFR